MVRAKGGGGVGDRCLDAYWMTSVVCTCGDLQREAVVYKVSCRRFSVLSNIN